MESIKWFVIYKDDGVSVVYWDTLEHALNHVKILEQQGIEPKVFQGKEIDHFSGV